MTDSSNTAAGAAPKTSGRARRNFRRAAIGVGVLAVLGAAFVLSLPPVTSWQTKSYLERLGAKSVVVDGLAINLATGEISFDRFQAVGPDDGVLRVGEARLRVDLAALLGRRVSVRSLSVADADIAIARNADGRWTVAGLPMEFGPTPGTPPVPPPPSEPWQLEAGSLAIDGSTVSLTLGGDTYKSAIDRMRIDSLSTLQPDRPTTISLKGRTADGTIELSGMARPFLSEPKAAFAVKVDNVTISAFEGPLTKGRIKDIDAKVSLEGKLSLDSAAAGTSALKYTGKLIFADVKTETTLFRTDAGSLAWDGELEIDIEERTAGGQDLLSVQVQGTASAAKFRFLNKKSGMELTGATATFDMSRSGVAFKPGVDTQGTSTITGTLAARLADARFVQPDSGLDVAAGRVALTGDAVLALPAGTADFTANLSGRLESDALKGSMTAAGIDALAAETLRLDYKGLALSLTADGAIAARTVATLSTEKFAIEARAAGISATASIVEGTGNRLAFDRTAAGAVELSVEGPLSGTRLRADAADAAWTASQDSFSWDGRIAVGGADPDNMLAARGDAKATGMVLALKKPAPMTATLDALTATGIKVAGPRAALADLSVSGFGAGPTDEKSDLPRAALRSLAVKGIASTGSRVEIDSLQGKGGNLELTRAQDGGLVLPASKPDQKDSGTDASATATPAAPAGKATRERDFALKVDNAILDDTRLSFTDKAVSPPFAIETSAFGISVRNLDTAKSGSDAAVTVAAGLGGFGTVDANGTVKPDAAEISTDLSIALKDIELFKFNPYIAAAIDRSVRQGRADGEIDLKIAAGRINAKTSLTIAKLEMAPPAGSDPRADGKPTDNGGPPIETAISLLQDKQGVIRLSIPVSGSLEDPKFDLSNAIGQAVAGALRDTVLTAFKIAFPLGTVIAVVDALGNPQIEIQPVPFSPGSADLSVEASQRVGEVAKYLKANGKVTPSVCGYATPADIPALKKANPKLTEAAVSAEAIGLSQARMNSVKTALAATHGIDAKRLFSCAPSIDQSADATARVTITP